MHKSPREDRPWPQRRSLPRPRPPRLHARPAPGTPLRRPVRTPPRSQARHGPGRPVPPDPAPPARPRQPPAEPPDHDPQKHQRPPGVRGSRSFPRPSATARSPRVRARRPRRCRRAGSRRWPPSRRWNRGSRGRRWPRTPGPHRRPDWPRCRRRREARGSWESRMTGSRRECRRRRRWAGPSGWPRCRRRRGAGRPRPSARSRRVTALPHHVMDLRCRVTARPLRGTARRRRVTARRRRAGRLPPRMRRAVSPWPICPLRGTAR